MCALAEGAGVAGQLIARANDYRSVWLEPRSLMIVAAFVLLSLLIFPGYLLDLSSIILFATRPPGFDLSIFTRREDCLFLSRVR